MGSTPFPFYYYGPCRKREGKKTGNASLNPDGLTITILITILPLHSYIVCLSRANGPSDCQKPHQGRQERTQVGLPPRLLGAIGSGGRMRRTVVGSALVRNELEIQTPLIRRRIRDPREPGVGKIQQRTVSIRRERGRISLPIRTACHGEVDDVLLQSLSDGGVVRHVWVWGAGTVVKCIIGILRMHAGRYTELIPISCIVESAVQPIGVAGDDDFAHEQDGLMELVVVRERSVEDGWVERSSDVGDG